MIGFSGNNFHVIKQFTQSQKFCKNICKKVLTIGNGCGIIIGRPEKGARLNLEN